jgi:hypothetical protein
MKPLTIGDVWGLVGGVYQRIYEREPTFQVTVGRKGIACGTGDEDAGLAILHDQEATDEEKLWDLLALLTQYERQSAPTCGAARSRRTSK